MSQFLSNLFYRLYKLFNGANIKKTYIHPDYNGLTSYAFSCVDEHGQNHDFYSFASAADMPTGRFTSFNEFLEDYNRRLDNAELVELFETMKDCMNQNSVEGVTNTMTLINYGLQRTQISMDVDLFMRFQSINFFTQEENLLNYDWDLANWKIEMWKRSGLEAFFLNEQVKKWLPSINLSKNDLDTLEAQRKGMQVFYRRLRDGLGKSSDTTTKKQTSKGSS